MREESSWSLSNYAVLTLVATDAGLKCGNDNVPWRTGLWFQCS